VPVRGFPGASAETMFVSSRYPAIKI
jgi:hypothetical protein